MTQIHCDDRDPVEVLAAEFLEQQRRGQNPTIAEFVASHPELALEIRELFPAIIAMERLKAHCEVPQVSRASLGATKLERLGEFRLLSEIGRGGMGIVYEALHESLGRHVAVKVLPKQSAKQCRAFQREARTAARLHHTNIVPLFGVGEQDGYHYIVMQLIRGVDLEAVLTALRNLRASGETAVIDSVAGSPVIQSRYAHDAIQLARSLAAETCQSPLEPTSVFGHSTYDQQSSDQPLAIAPDMAEPAPGQSPEIQKRNRDKSGKTTATAGGSDVTGTCPLGPQYWRRIAVIGRQSADALHYAHLQRTQHRDIKPANLLLDAQGVVWITDFGLAKAMDDTHESQWGNLAGTLRYMAPEQFSDQCDHRSDIYSLGLTLYELLTLQPAFADSSRSNLIRKITQEPPSPPSKLCSGIPCDLDSIVMKAIACEPSERYQSAGELARDLQRFLEDRPVSARQMPVVERLWRWARRNRAVAVLSAAAGVFLLTTAVFASAQYIQRTRAWEMESQLRTQAESERMRAEANLQLAAEAFEDVFGRVTGAPLPGSLDGAMEEIPSNSGNRAIVSENEAAILKGLLAFYDQFATHNEKNLRWQRESARAFRRAGEIQFRLGNNQEADATLRRALTIYQKLSDSEPTKSEYIAGVAATRNLLANVAWETGRRDVALDESRKAWQDLLRHPANLASSAACRLELARAYNRYATTSPQFHVPFRPGSMHKHRPVDSREYLQRSIDIANTLLSDSPGNIEYSLTMAESYRYLWGLESRRKRFTEAQRAREQAIHLLEELANTFPDEPECSFTLVEVYLLPYRFGSDEVTDSASTYQTDRAVKIASELVSRFPQVPKHQVVLAQSLWAAARAQKQIGQAVQAKAYLEEAIALQKSIMQQFPSRSRNRHELIRFLEDRTRQLRANGRPQELQVAMEELITEMENIVEPFRSFPSSLRSRAKTYADFAEVLRDQGQPDRAQAAEVKAKELTNEATRRSTRPSFRPPQSASVGSAESVATKR